MTTDVQVPYIDVVGDGTKLLFTFEFSIVESMDLLVLVSGVLQVENSTYQVVNITDDGGEILFSEPPPAGSRVLIFRATTVSQNVDYRAFDKFPADTHEWNLDKITFILQELINGAFVGKDSDGNDVYMTFDLSVSAGETTVTIHNSGGTDAILPPWESGVSAGVFHGELTDSAPPDESATTKPDGYVWIEV